MKGLKRSALGQDRPIPQVNATSTLTQIVTGLRTWRVTKVPGLDDWAGRALEFSQAAIDD